MTWSTTANFLKSRKCPIDRDRLYALFALLPPSILQVPGMKPSYDDTTTTNGIFINVSYNIMELSQSLMMFNFLHRSTPDYSAGLPPWVPDWRLAPKNKYDANLRVARERLFNPSDGTSFYLCRLSSNTICLKELFVDIVRACQNPGILPTASPILHSIYEAWQNLWTNNGPPDRLVFTPYMHGTPTATAFQRTMVWDCEPGLEAGQLERLTPKSVQLC
jgi:hypothetical protein